MLWLYLERSSTDVVITMYFPNWSLSPSCILRNLDVACDANESTKGEYLGLASITLSNISNNKLI